MCESTELHPTSYRKSTDVRSKAPHTRTLQAPTRHGQTLPTLLRRRSSPSRKCGTVSEQISVQAPCFKLHQLKRCVTNVCASVTETLTAMVPSLQPKTRSPRTGDWPVRTPPKNHFRRDYNIWNTYGNPVSHAAILQYLDGLSGSGEEWTGSD